MRDFIDGFTLTAIALGILASVVYAVFWLAIHTSVPVASTLAFLILCTCGGLASWIRGIGKETK